MKARIFLRFFSTVIILLICNAQDVLGQTTRMDSIIYEKDLTVLDGFIPMHYSSQCEKRAIELYEMLLDVYDTFSDDEKEVMKLKFAVIDSLQWPGIVTSYGLFSARWGWIMAPGDLTFEQGAKIYGYESFNEVLLKELEINSKIPEDIVTGLYKHTIIHEIGHFYVLRILKARPPDRWTSELMASYFATDFLYHNDKNALESFNLLCSTFTKELNPTYRKLSDFNELYSGGVGVQNYAWYQTMFQHMIEDIYPIHKGDFMDLFAKTFPQTSDPIKYSQEEVLKMMDLITEGKASGWIRNMEAK